jgi:hypothetical protein
MFFDENFVEFENEESGFKLRFAPDQGILEWDPK